MKQTCLILTLAGVLFATSEPATFTGVITDTMCGSTHGMMKAPSDEVCVKMCVKGSSDYALFDGKHVLKLSDQRRPAKFAAQRVKVIGTYDAKAGRSESRRLNPPGMERANDRRRRTPFGGIVLMGAHGFSTREQPGVLERWIARRARSIVAPSGAKAQTNPTVNSFEVQACSPGLKRQF